MNPLNIVFLLMLFALASASPRTREYNMTDTELGLAFIECARKAILTGIPEIDVPSHDPLIIKRNLNRTIEWDQVRVSIAMNNLVMEDIPIWEVRQFDLVEANDEGIDVFNYTIYWPRMILKSQWQFSTAVGGMPLVDAEGSLALELDHVNFTGVLNFTKSGSGRNQTINDLKLDITTVDAHVYITNLGNIGDDINRIGGKALAFLVNHNPAKNLLAEGLKMKLIRDWILKPERLDILIEKCKE